MNEITQKEIAIYLEKADEALKVSRLNLLNNFFAASINRSYYAIFYAANALLATRKLARSKHSGVLSAFRQGFIKTGILSSGASFYR